MFVDLIECLIQRDFGYNTRSVRVLYLKIKEALLNEGLKKVVVVAHSQGGIITSLALDNLLADLPRECYPPLNPVVVDE
jgi:alpha-beta hydrolase superfamily lysophospholipase